MPGTDGAFDLYWIVVHPHSAGAGAGSVLLREVEGRVCEAGGRLLVVETSGRDDYDGARGFYLRRGYVLAGRVADFYAPGDDRLILVRRIGEALAGAIPEA
jgi:ribosomal protein S18 acetylase RimI-like enzyme